MTYQPQLKPNCPFPFPESAKELGHQNCHIQKRFLSKLIWKKTLQTFFFYIFCLDVKFENLTVRLYVLIISSMLAKFQEDQRLIAIKSMTCLNIKFLW